MMFINQSNVAIKISQDPESRIENNEIREEIDPNYTPIITENVPFINQPKPISFWYIIANINLTLSSLLLAVLPSLGLFSSLATFLLAAYTIAAYLIYIAAAYKFSNIYFLLQLQSLHEYEAIFQKLQKADCKLRFSYSSGRNRIDQSTKKVDEECKKVVISDKSGKLYSIERDYRVAFIRYKKRFYFADKQSRDQIMESFHVFVQRCRKQIEGGKKKLLGGKQKIQLEIVGFEDQVGYYMEQDNHCKCLFIATLFGGFAVYFEILIGHHILRYQMDIVKQIRLKR